MVSDEGYRTMTRSLRRVADSLGVGVGVVLEGGYELGALARSVAATMEELAADGERPAVSLDVHPLAAEALERIGRLGPQLAGGA
jgi:acetoin utilization deacetylase AcuC-like enzyme